jgi:transporter family protein
MTNWLSASMIALCSFGLWGLFTKLSVEYIDFKRALIYQTLGVMIVGLISLGLIGFKPEASGKGFGFALLTGVAYGIGCLFYFLAASKGKIITVVTLTALYPMVTIVLAYFILQETITLKQIIGIGLAIFSILLMSV